MLDHARIKSLRAKYGKALPRCAFGCPRATKLVTTEFHPQGHVRAPWDPPSVPSHTESHDMCEYCAARHANYAPGTGQKVTVEDLVELPAGVARWNDSTVTRLRQAHAHPGILADALEEAGYANGDVLTGLRGPEGHKVARRLR